MTCSTDEMIRFGVGMRPNISLTPEQRQTINAPIIAARNENNLEWARQLYFDHIQVDPRFAGMMLAKWYFSQYGRE